MKYMMDSSLLLMALLFLAPVSALYHRGEQSGAVDVQVGAQTSGNRALESNGSATGKVDVSNAPPGEGSASDVQSTSIGVTVAPDRIVGHVKTNLNLSVDTGVNGTSQGRVRARLSNGRFAEIKVLPETASAVAQANAQVRCADNNCSLVLK